MEIRLFTTRNSFRDVKIFYRVRLTLVDTVSVLEVTCQHILIFEQFLAELTLHGLVPMGRLVSFPPVVVKEGLVAEVAGVAVLGLLVVQGWADRGGGSSLRLLL